MNITWEHIIIIFLYNAAAAVDYLREHSNLYQVDGLDEHCNDDDDDDDDYNTAYNACTTMILWRN